MPAHVTLAGISEVFSAADIECLVRAAGEAVCGDVDSLSSLERALAERAYALTQAEDDPDDTPPLGSTANPQTVRVRDAEVRVFNRNPDSDDASDMYVLEVFGLSVLIRLRRDDTDDSATAAAPFVHIDNENREPCTLAVEVCNGGETDYAI